MITDGATLTGLEINCTSDLNPGGLMQISIDLSPVGLVARNLVDVLSLGGAA